MEAVHSFAALIVASTGHKPPSSIAIRFWKEPCGSAFGETQIMGPGEQVAALPAGPINHHWTKNLIANRDGSRLYVTVGSNSNAAENGLSKEEHRVGEEGNLRL
jgi:hypothetical protein